MKYAKGGGAGTRRPRLPAALIRFVELFNEKEYWKSHEVLEEPWHVNRSNFYQGMIIFASGFVHAQRGNPVGVGKQMAKVPRYLDAYRPHYMGIDVDEVLRLVNECRKIATSSSPPRGDALRDRIPFPVLSLDASRVRGGRKRVFHLT